MMIISRAMILLYKAKMQLLLYEIYLVSIINIVKLISIIYHITLFYNKISN